MLIFKKDCHTKKTIRINEKKKTTYTLLYSFFNVHTSVPQADYKIIIVLLAVACVTYVRKTPNPPGKIEKKIRRLTRGKMQFTNLRAWDVVSQTYVRKTEKRQLTRVKRASADIRAGQVETCVSTIYVRGCGKTSRAVVYAVKPEIHKQNIWCHRKFFVIVTFVSIPVCSYQLGRYEK